MPEGQFGLAGSYAFGAGLVKDQVLAYKWNNLAAMHFEGAREFRTILEGLMTREQIAEGQRLSREFLSRSALPVSAESISSGEPQMQSFGSGFFISEDGLLVTAAHVVAEASEIRVYWNGKRYTATPVFIDRSLDLAVLSVAGVDAIVPLAIAPSGRVRTGDSVFTLGFPQVQLQGAEAKFTDGSISSLSGPAGDPKFFQISVPVQPGNSGGPLVDAQGNVVGIVLSRLNELKVLLATGSLPQNVNYALKSGFLLPLLESLPQFAESMPAPYNLERPAAISRTQNAVALIVTLE